MRSSRLNHNGWWSTFSEDCVSLLQNIEWRRFRHAVKTITNIQFHPHEVIRVLRLFQQRVWCFVSILANVLCCQSLTRPQLIGCWGWLHCVCDPRRNGALLAIDSLNLASSDCKSWYPTYLTKSRPHCQLIRNCLSTASKGDGDSVFRRPKSMSAQSPTSSIEVTLRSMCNITGAILDLKSWPTIVGHGKNSIHITIDACETVFNAARLFSKAV